jgi:hypothetical protein
LFWGLGFWGSGVLGFWGYRKYFLMVLFIGVFCSFFVCTGMPSFSAIGGFGGYRMAGMTRMLFVRWTKSLSVSQKTFLLKYLNISPS